MVFQDRYGWHCQFLEADLKTPWPRKLTFASPDKIIESVEPGGIRCFLSLFSRFQAPVRALSAGRFYPNVREFR
jgi:hypothetical protein